MKSQKLSNILRKFGHCLLVVWMMLTCRTTSGQTPGTTVQLCSNLVPGLDKMSQGIDIVYFDLNSKTNVDLKNQICPYTCQKGKKTTIGGIEHDLPDQVDSVTAIPGGILDSTVKLVKTYNESRDVVAENLEVGGIYRMFGFSGSKTLKFLQHSVFNKSSYVEKVSAFESARRVRLLPDYALELHPRAQDFIDQRLSSEFDPNDPATLYLYREFIRYFGTHYFQTANFGGLLVINFETKDGYYLKNSDNKVRKEAGANFLKILGGRGIVETQTVKVDEVFESMTTSHIEYFGGSANLLEPGGYQKWQPTVSTKPWLFMGNLEPIFKLIRNDSKKAIMERVVADYVLRAYLNELSSLIWSRQRMWQNGLSELQQLQDKVREFRNKTLLTSPEMTSLSQEVLEEVTVPAVFRDRTRKCYDWFPGGAGQCSGPTPHLCVAPGMMIQADLDETGPGGCHAWGTPARHDAWFRDLQLCFRWEQCKGDWKREFCKSINDLTTSYRDDDDARGRDCQVSWKVIIPSDARVWQRNFRLCFLWRPEQEGEPCGGELCVVGDWTPYSPDKLKLLQECTSGAESTMKIATVTTALWFCLLSLFCS